MPWGKSFWECVSVTEFNITQYTRSNSRTKGSQLVCNQLCSCITQGRS